MTELLKQALTLTGLGMGMTFTSIGALVIGMYLMTVFIKDRRDPNVDGQADLVDVSENIEQENLVSIEEEKLAASEDDIRFQAVAASVAVALSLSEESEVRQKKPITGRNSADTWNQYVRLRHLSQRSQYEQLKHR